MNIVSKMLCGGISNEEIKADDKINAMLEKLRPKIAEKIALGDQPMTALSYKSQIVAGKNYFVKVKNVLFPYSVYSVQVLLLQVSAGESIGHFHVRIYEDLKGEVSLSGIQHPKTKDDEIQYFEIH